MAKDENYKYIDIYIISYRKLVNYIFSLLFKSVGTHDNVSSHINIQTRGVEDLLKNMDDLVSALEVVIRDLHFI